MSAELPDELLTVIETTIRDYALIGSGERIVVALSGGKDSMLLCRALQALGHEFVAATIDMGYEMGWAERITRLANGIGVPVEVIGVREPGPIPIAISRRIALLDSMGPTAVTTGRTPCTHCYSVKVLSLARAARYHRVRRVAFAHHMADAAASLLKEALLHVDRFDRGNAAYRRSHFEALVSELAEESRHDQPEGRPLTGRIVELVRSAVVDTDEPPRQPLLHDDPDGIEIVRPFFGAQEDLIATTVRSLGIATEGSGCGHGATAQTETPREMVHRRVLAGRGGSPFTTLAERLVRSGITDRGTGRVRSRQRRAELLGCGYKAAETEPDKL